MTEPVAWIDGKLQTFGRTALPVWDLGVVGGVAITELARTFRHQPFRLSDHIQRLTTSVAELGFPQRYSASDLFEAAMTVLQQNCRQIRPDSDLGIVLFTTAGTNATYLHGEGSAFGTTVIHTFELPFAMWRQSLESGVRLRIPSIRQISSDSVPVHLKTRNRIHWWLADKEAAAQEPGSKALLLNQAECVTETSTSCFYAVIDNEIITPSTHVLNSMTRRVVEQISTESGLRFRKAPIHVNQLSSISEAFLSSTPVCLLPVSHINSQPVGDGVPGPIFRQLMHAWNRMAGIDIAAQILQRA